MAKRAEKLYHPLRGDPGVAKTTPGGAFFKTGLATIQGPQPSNFENSKNTQNLYYLESVKICVQILKNVNKD